MAIHATATGDLPLLRRLLAGEHDDGRKVDIRLLRTSAQDVAFMRKARHLAISKQHTLVEIALERGHTEIVKALVAGTPLPSPRSAVSIDRLVEALKKDSELCGGLDDLELFDVIERMSSSGSIHPLVQVDALHRDYKAGDLDKKDFVDHLCQICGRQKVVAVVKASAAAAAAAAGAATACITVPAAAAAAAAAPAAAAAAAAASPAAAAAAAPAAGSTSRRSRVPPNLLEYIEKLMQWAEPRLMAAAKEVEEAQRRAELEPQPGRQPGLRRRRSGRERSLTSSTTRRWCAATSRKLSRVCLCRRMPA